MSCLLAKTRSEAPAKRCNVKKSRESIGCMRGSREKDELLLKGAHGAPRGSLACAGGHLNRPPRQLRPSARNNFANMGVRFFDPLHPLKIFIGTPPSICIPETYICVMCI